MSKKNKNANKGGLKILALLAMLIVIAAVFGYKKLDDIKKYNKAYQPENSKTVEFTVSRGEGYKTIAAHLEEAGIIENADVFSMKTKLLKLGPKYQAGTFALSPSMTMEEIMSALQDAKRDTVRFTIPEGYTIRQTAEKLEADGIVSAADFYAALEKGNFDYWFLNDLKADKADPTGKVSAAANKYEGFLFPETYEVFKGADAEAVINKMFSQFDKIFDDDMKAQLKERKLDIKGIVTAASLIERETADDEERPKVASVIYNRLAINMPLQLDCAIQYILGDPKALLSTKDTQIDSPYNIYTHTGLTPGPIASPGLASIKAALAPAETDYLYYVLKQYGGTTHNFAVTYDEFLKYKNEYKKTIK